MVNKRLKWYLESINWISPHQFGFRELRSTTDHVNLLQSDICEAFAEDQQCIVVSLDLKKAFDMAWTHRIICILWRLGLSGHTLFFVFNFLTGRSIQVRVHGVLSAAELTEDGLPQAAILSVTLFLIAINELLTILPKPIRVRAFADDITLTCSGKIGTIAKIIQDGLNKLNGSL